MKRQNLIIITFIVALASLHAQKSSTVEPAKCQSLCVIPEVWKTETEKVMVRAASSRLEIIPAKYETVTEKVLLREASNRIEPVPAVYETITEKVLAKQGTTALRIIPARYETVTEKVLVKEAYTQLVSVPAKYETVTEKRLVKEASTRQVVIPAVYEKVSEQKLVSEASSRLEIVPAKFETVTERVLIKEASTRLVPVAAVYETVTERKLVSEASTRIDKIPARYEIKTETREISPATTRYEMRKQAGCLSPNPGDCMFRCEIAVPASYETVQIKVNQGCPDGYSNSGDDCIKTIEVPAVYKDVPYKKLVSPATSKIEEIPAVYADRTITKLVTPASTKSVDIPAKYETVTYQKLVTPATTKLEEIPAVYADVTYQKLVSPATTNTIEVPAEYTNRTYQKLVSPSRVEEIPCGAKSIILENIIFETNSAILRPSSYTEINELAAMLKEQSGISAKLVGHTDDQGPDDKNQILSENRAKAVYTALIAKGIDASRLSFEGKGETTPIATNETDAGRQKNRRTEMITNGDLQGKGDCDTYINRTYQKLVSAATTKTVEIPAEYGNRTYQKLVSAATTRSIDVPAEYKTISKKVLVKAGGYTEWRDVLCESNITPELIGKIQSLLREKGYDVGPATTTLNAAIKSALVKYQKDNNLPIGGALDYETLKSLGVEQ